jgi:hypothetical protein
VKGPRHEGEAGHTAEVVKVTNRAEEILTPATATVNKRSKDVAGFIDRLLPVKPRVELE